MSARKLVYEGSDPEHLLLEVWNAHGADARISEPERVAKGGIFGFFAKTHYRVEVDPTTVPFEPASPAARAGSPLAERSPTARALDALVEGTEDVFDSAALRRRSFDEVLAGVASSLGEDPGVLAERGVSDPIPTAAIPASMAMPASMARPAAPARASLRPTAPASADAPPSRPFVASPPPVEMPTNLLRRDEPEVSPITLLRQAGFPPRLLGLLESRGLTDFSLEAAFALLPPAPTLPSVPGSLVAVVGSPADAPTLAAALGAELGLPGDEIARACERAEPARGRARPASADLVAPDLLVHDVASASALAPGWRRDRVGVVAVVADDSRAGRAWARSMLRAMRPSATIAVADARTKNEDLATFLAAIGGVDALALVGAERTVTPAQLLALDVPVARLGTAPATGSGWADIVRSAAERRAA